MSTIFNCAASTDGKPVSWGDGPVKEGEEPGVPPTDEHNVKLLDACQPREWVMPDRGDDFVYDLIAIGAGAGGLVSAKQTARRGGKSALIEKHMAGGDCLNYGCVPSKALLRCAKVSRGIEHAAGGAYGGTFNGESGYKVDFPAVMARMRKIRAQISPADACSGSANVGVDIFNGHAKFTGANSIEVNGRTLKFKKAVVATGGRAFVPPIPGLKEAPHLTNNSLFNLKELPKRMVVVGAGPIGLEMAQAFANFGSEVTVLEMAPKILPREDLDAAKVVTAALVEDGVKFFTNIKFIRVEGDHSTGVSKVVTEHEGVEKVFEADALLVATGRAANVDGVGLEAAGIEYTRHGVKVDDELRTSNANVYAVGDVCTVYKFTHVAGTMAQMVVQNAFFNGDNGVPRTVSGMTIPWVTYTEPEIAHVGDSQDDEKQDTYVSQLEHNDRAICEGRNVGFVKIHCEKGTDKIVGATIVADAAGEMISELTLAIQFKIGLGQAGLGSVIHSYPTVADAIGGCAFQYKMKTWETLQ